MKKLLSVLFAIIMLATSAGIASLINNPSVLTVGAANTTKATTTTVTYKTTAKLNMRKKADKNSDKVVSVPKDAKVTSSGKKSNGYMYVSYKTSKKTYKGWVLADCLKKVTSSTFGKVTGLKASSINSSSVKLLWNKVSGAKGYKVYKYQDSTKKYTLLYTTTNTAKTVSKLKAGTTYKFAVKAYKVTNGKTVYGSFSALVKVTTTKSETTTTKKSTEDLSISGGLFSPERAGMIYDAATSKRTTYKELAPGAEYFEYNSGGDRLFKTKPGGETTTEGPSYNADYCPICGKMALYKNGADDACAHGGCTSRYFAWTCSHCGEKVEANECHTCKK